MLIVGGEVEGWPVRRRFGGISPRRCEDLLEIEMRCDV
jgi:hypothetical protein